MGLIRHSLNGKGNKRLPKVSIIERKTLKAFHNMYLFKSLPFSFLSPQPMYLGHPLKIKLTYKEHKVDLIS